MIFTFRLSNKVFFECKVVETNTVVISGAYVELHKIKGVNAGSEPAVEAPKASDEFKAEKIFDELNLKLKSNPSIAKSVNAIYEFNISKGDSSKVFLADLKKGVITSGNPDKVKAQCTILIKDDDFISLASGTANPQSVTFST